MNLKSLKAYLIYVVKTAAGLRNSHLDTDCCIYKIHTRSVVGARFEQEKLWKSHQFRPIGYASRLRQHVIVLDLQPVVRIGYPELNDIR